MNITVYCGASEGNNKVYKLKTIELGNWISKNDHHLVYGGGNVGLMGTIADTVISNNGYVTGIIPNFLVDREIAHPNLSELIRVDTMSERKSKMVSMGEVFIALPGGPGTLEEITEVISWSRLGKNNGPCILYNVNGYFDALKMMYSHMVEEGFLSQTDKDSILFSDQLEVIEEFINNYQLPKVRTY